MSRPFIVVGDKTDHGGEVIQGSASTDAAGKPMARVGDQVTCPKKGHGGTTVIASGDPSCMIDGRPAARHGDKTACGATLLSSQIATTD
ncbi:MAG: PAAR domain-containing protein [Methylibium sp.]|uniref:PAAR domain-containing protein n=1 Tax=Methylibium sp. TaxID=2067992 RepID=UPI0017D9F531|nr:PAAR domain-containing protein [Methylibium sp.]MBA3596209.1 PAAR domain-containing protein [Methylibium sp.]